MSGEWLRAFGFFFVVAFLGVVAYAALPRLFGAASGPEGELLTLIKSHEADGLVISLPGQTEPLRSTKAHFDRITITVSPDGKSAEAVATLDFTGGFGGTKVSSLGFEKIHFVKVEREWQARDGLASRLARIVQALEARRVALERGDATALTDAGISEEQALWLSYTDRRLVSRAWYIRSERDEVHVTEDATLSAVLPDRPVHEVMTKRLVLREAPSGEFFFPGGLL